MMLVDFDWNQGNSDKLKKHGVDSCDIEDLLNRTRLSLLIRFIAQ